MASWSHEFPDLTSTNHRITSKATTDYNCIAWAVGEDDRWWWPSDDYYWPSADRGPSYANFERMLLGLGYSRCANGELEAGQEKVVIYTKGKGRRMEVTHASRQLEGGEWTSKLGPSEDISHDLPKNLRSRAYGVPYAFFKRSIK